MDAVTRAEVAHQLLAAYQSGVPIEPPSSTHAGMAIEDAYAVQLLQVHELLARGRKVLGHEVGLTNARVQKQLGVDQPDYGHLFDDFFFLEHQPIPMSRFLQPRVEPEIAFVLRKPLRGPGVTVAQAIDAVDYVVPSIEIVDSRVADWRITIVDTIADNASSGAVVLGSTPTKLTEVDLRLVGCTFRKNGQVVGTGAGGAVLGSPISSLVWLANTVGALGVTLEAGHVVLPGSLTPVAPVTAGDTFTASFGGLGTVTARFV